MYIRDIYKKGQLEYKKSKRNQKLKNMPPFFLFIPVHTKNLSKNSSYPHYTILPKPIKYSKKWISSFE